MHGDSGVGKMGAARVHAPKPRALVRGARWGDDWSGPVLRERESHDWTSGGDVAPKTGWERSRIEKLMMQKERHGDVWMVMRIGAMFLGIVPAFGAQPACNLGTQQSFRAGYPAQLDGSGSSPLDGGTFLSYVWQLVSGPSGLSWSSHSVPRPRVRGLVFGSYVFQLTVTDSSNQSSSCTVKDGAVATDNNDIVITNNSAVDTLLGPMVRWGANPWPWYDNRHKAAADYQISVMDTMFPAWWDTPGPGTVTVTNGSATIVGSGTTFTTTFCKGPSQPTVPKDSGWHPMIAVWHTLGAGTGRRMEGILSCTDDTHITIYGDVWNADGTTPQGSRLTYAADPTGQYALNWEWGSMGAPANYYDNVAAYYALYYRSGIDDYLTAARAFADRFWESPMVDQGVAPSGFPFGITSRSTRDIGLVRRALAGRPDMWTGLHLICPAIQCPKYEAHN